ncbi:MAG TPA: hypothetical protein VJ023_00005 [Pyrinomonadaceae bacterium]|nr:hypothetical protein [Pyrinomonadaceae bacterium]
MEVEYQLTTDDLFAVHWRAAYESRRARRSRYLLYLYLFVALFIVFTVPAMTDEGYVISTPTLSAKRKRRACGMITLKRDGVFP